MHLNPYFYQKLVRPKFAIKKYIKNIVEKEFDFKDKKILDFWCWTGSNSFIFDSKNYIWVDIEKQRIEFASKLFPKYNFKCIENSSLDLTNNSLDYICIFAVIHHISDDIFKWYIDEFKRVLKNDWKIVIIEPVLNKKYKFSNWFMNTVDDWEYIRYEEEYLSLFENDFTVKVHKRFNKFFLYNEIFFSLSLK